MASVVQEQPNPQVLPASLTGQERAPVILTAQTLLRERGDITFGLREARFDLRYVAAWNRLPEAIERIRADIVLVDMDAADLMCDGLQNISGHRLVLLLARQLAHRPVALVIMTRLDFVEIEDLARAGVHAIVAPDISAYAFVEQARIALRNARQRHHPLSGSLGVTIIPRQDDANEISEQALSAGRDDGWRLSDQLWRRMEELLPATRHPERTRPLDRRAIDAIFFVLRSGVPWNRLPETFCSAATARARLRQWAARGIIEELLAAGLDAQTAWEHLHWERLAPVFPPTVAQLARTKTTRPAPLPAPATRVTEITEITPPCPLSPLPAMASATSVAQIATPAQTAPAVRVARARRAARISGKMATAPQITLQTSESAQKQGIAT